ncbi:MAG: pantoate--beta-alanine ligase [Turneriella sp.]|nr:pantoate--beta-alanine ligase [Turneriella sp.]
MQIIETRAAMREFAESHRHQIGFVPTMGYLHEGHLSLVRRARAENPQVVVSIFVNPAQFNDPNDLKNYPVDLKRDLALLAEENIDAVFVPTVGEIYPRGIPALRLRYDALMGRLCGRFRPGHFEGVLLIVHNLLQWVMPQKAYFGLKDYQQFLLVWQMACDLEFPVEIIGCPVVREPDGLAMSSRNVRLSPEGRKKALAIPKALFAAQEAWQEGQSLAAIARILQEQLSGLKVDYAELCDPLTLESLDLQIAVRPSQVLVAVAAWVEEVRLIDNVILTTT